MEAGAGFVRICAFLLALLAACPAGTSLAGAQAARSASGDPSLKSPVFSQWLIFSPAASSTQAAASQQPVLYPLAPVKTASLVAPPAGKVSDTVVSAEEVDRRLSASGLDGPEEGVRDGFFDTASEEVEKGREGDFARLTNPIEKFIRYFTNRGRKRFETYLARSGKYGDMMRGILSKYGLPEDLIYLALIESGFSPKAYSSAKAAGPWQFISATGRRYGLRIDWWTDERRDAEKSTHAAASYLKDLYGMFESWPLAAAAYNAGEGKIIKAVNRYKSDDFAELIRYRYLKQETKDYVPKMLAALAIAKEPEKYGFSDVVYEAPLDLKKVVVPGGTDLMETARILEVDHEDLRDWNPELRRFCTPPTQADYELRLSAEAASRAEERMEAIRTQAKVTFLQHNVRKKETLDGLAAKYGTSTAILRELNGLKGESLRRVSRLIIPVTGLAAEETAPGKEIAPEQLTMAHMRVEEGRRKAKAGTTRKVVVAEAKKTVRVRKGDTLFLIAKEHGVSVEALAAENGLQADARVQAGKRLVLPEGAAQAPKARAKVVRNKAHRGDS
ncbi:MAG: transglycosylase SLT domain-containing protein [Thermodesulfobacteriota bacterium]